MDDIIIVDRNETDRLEKILLDWLLVAFVFFVAGIMLKHTTSWGYYFSLIVFAITILFLLITVVDYFKERQELMLKGIQPTVRSDILAIGAVLSILLTIWIINRILREEIFCQKNTEPL